MVKAPARAMAQRAGEGERGRGMAGEMPRIRVALPRDVEALAALRRQAEEVHARLLPDYFRVGVASRPPVIAGAGMVTLVAERSARATTRKSAPAVTNGRAAARGAAAGRAAAEKGPAVVGYVTVKVVETPRDPAMTPRRRAHVETVVVDEEHRGDGVGTALMRAAAAWARRREAEELVLTVWSDNAAAEALYRRLGYQPIARILRRPL